MPNREDIARKPVAAAADAVAAAAYVACRAEYEWRDDFGNWWYRERPLPTPSVAGLNLIAPNRDGIARKPAAAAVAVVAAAYVACRADYVVASAAYY